MWTKRQADLVLQSGVVQEAVLCRGGALKARLIVVGIVNLHQMKCSDAVAEGI
jgi:hypothetical protein